MNQIIYTVISVLLFIIGIYLFNKKINPSKLKKIIFAIIVLIVLSLFILYVVCFYFTGEGINDAAIYHIKYGLNGAGFKEYISIIMLAFTSVIITILFIFKLIIFKTKINNPKPIYELLSFILILTSLLINPAILDIYKLKKSNNINEIKENKTLFLNYYRKPTIKAIKKNHKNLVFIYAESLELTYFNNQIFPKLITEINNLKQHSIIFKEIDQAPMTGWTIAGITASQCGIPLVTPSHGNSMSGMDQFVSGATCIGDLLSKEGYYLEFNGGANLDFAGKGNFFRTHAFDKVSGKQELLPYLQDKSYITGWGLYDDTLLDIVYNRFIKLSERNRKFGLFTLTLDTHHPKGHLSKTCNNIKYKNGSNPILNAVKCSDYLISKFINKIMMSKYAKNTVIILVSDHLAMRNTAYKYLTNQNRRNLFMIIDRDINKVQTNNNYGTTLDIGVTILPFLGYKGNIGLGRNLLSKEYSLKDTLFIIQNLRKWKNEIQKYWRFPKINNELEININKKYIRFDNRKFKIPILIEVNDNKNTILKFEFNKSKSHRSLIDYIKIDKKKKFILINNCKLIRTIDKLLPKEGFCIITSDGNGYTLIKHLKKNIILNKNEINKLLHLEDKKSD